MRSWNHGLERSLGRREGWGCEADRFIMYGWMDGLIDRLRFGY